ncbi:MAG: CheY-like receiver protein [Idiomarinaceae bacterium HL-53]|nr:MAG: CheY-like receiver protein [Idiomarinaceae bacterium HL-53]CUS48391.1 CheY chemotaxis protein or a CheY-like REC (receiver) domain [Idiomarinaceae bacterium HL-53]
MSDSFLFADEPEVAQNTSIVEPFNILIVDDDEEIHVITKMALSDFKLDDRPLAFTSVYSGQEAREILKEDNNFAMMLLDVVMEDDHAGLDLVRWTRAELKNRMIRIVLRTGQPGQAPEEEVIAKYEIDDYKEKTELTYRKLMTLMYSSLRAYRDLQAIERYKAGLERIIEASAEIFSAKSMNQLSQGILEQLVALLTRSNTAAYYRIDGFTASGDKEHPMHIIAATGEFKKQIGESVRHELDREIVAKLVEQASHVGFEVVENTYYGVYKTSAKHFYLLYIRGINELNETDRKLLDMFMNNTAIAFEHAEVFTK